MLTDTPVLPLEGDCEETVGEVDAADTAVPGAKIRLNINISGIKPCRIFIITLLFLLK
jgi:hypothetical protein